jgi:hypothetical protein
MTVTIKSYSNIADPSAFASLQRAAKLSSAAYTGCLGTAFDVTITKQIYNVITDTQVINPRKSTDCALLTNVGLCRILIDAKEDLCSYERLNYA